MTTKNEGVYPVGTMRRLLSILGVSLLLFLLFPLQKALAVDISYLFVEEQTILSELGYFAGRNVYSKTIPVNYVGGKVVLSSTPDGKGSFRIHDRMVVSGNRTSQTLDRRVDCLNQIHTLPPQDITFLFSTIDSYNEIRILFQEHCGRRPVVVGPIYIVILDGIDDEPEPSPTPTPTPPEPFLDLPWEYGNKTFTEAALSINSYFDHEYPLLSTGLDEGEAVNTLVRYDSNKRSGNPYSSHDGYDWGRRANAKPRDPVLAAASGFATYRNQSSCSACGDHILIDHENGYQTRYYHLLSEELVTHELNNPIWVEKGQRIGLVGWTGHVIPGGIDGAHIHFMVIEDKNKDGDFDDNIPDGLVDPFGWQSLEPDPWEKYVFAYNGESKTGNKSYYLWQKKLDNLDESIPANGGIFSAGKHKITVPEGAIENGSSISLEAQPSVNISEILQSIGSTVEVVIKDSLGNLISSLNKPIEISISFSPEDIRRYNVDTLSIYSSSDGGITWQKESTVSDFIRSQATAQVSHLTLFALVGERIDMIPPISKLTLQGQGINNLFGSDITAVIDATDNEDGLGVDYTLYKLDNSDFLKYVEPLVITEEGSHTISYYSVDKDDNVESIKEVIFSIDKTIPELAMYFDPPSADMKFVSRVSTSSATVTKEIMDPRRYIYHMKNALPSGRSLGINGMYIDRENINDFRMDYMKYDSGSNINLVGSRYVVTHQRLNGNYRYLVQVFESGNQLQAKLEYSILKNNTKITYKLPTGGYKTIEKPGMSILQVYTENGTLKYSY